MGQLSIQQLHRALGGEMSSGQVLCPGPGHSERDRSLAVKPADGDDGFVVFSHAGDDPLQCKDHVRQKLGLPPFQARNGKDHSARGDRKIVATYDYLDEGGSSLYQVVRFDPKDFRQRRPDGKGGWVWNLEGVRRVPYRLPELIEALASEKPIFVVEGEKDVESLRAIGMPATCNAQGAGKWRDEYSEHFKGAVAYVIPDNDEPGQKHAEEVAKSLTEGGAQVRVISLPGLSDHGDLSDWLKSGGSAEGLYALADATPIWSATDQKQDWRAHTISAAALQHMRFPPVTYVVPGLIVEGLSILAGRPKLGKSWAALDICLGTASGRKVLGDIDTVSGDVLYCALEDTQRRLQSRTTRLLGTYRMPWPARLTLATRWRRLDAGGVDDVAAWANSVPEPRLVVLDTLAGVRPQRQAADQIYDGDYKALLGLHQLAGSRRIAVLVLHHTRKMDADDPLDTVSGSLGLAGCADSVLVLARGNQGTTLYVRGRDVEETNRAVLFDKATCRWSILGDAAEVHRSDERSRILSVLETASELLSPQAIADAAGMQKNNVYQLLHKMVPNGQIIKSSLGKYRHPDRTDLESGDPR